MKDIVKVEYNNIGSTLVPVSNTDFPVNHFVGYNSELMALVDITDKEGNVTKRHIEVREESFIEDFNKVCYVYAHPTLNTPYHYNTETGIWDEIITGRFTLSDWFYENTLVPPFREVLKTNEYGNLVGKELRKLSGKLATRSMTKGDNTPLGEQPNPNIIAFENGTYDFKTNTIRETVLEDYHTVQLQYPLIEETDESKILAVDWMRFVLEDNAQAMFEYIGYMYYREYKYQNIAFLINDPNKSKSGSNGKSQVGGFIVDNLFGKQNSSAVGIDLLSDSKNRFDKASLHHKLVNFEADSSGNFLNATNTLKKLSGGRDSVHAERKGLDAFSFINYAKLMFSMNELPSFNDRTNGWYRRLLIIPFPKDFSTDKYTEELKKYNEQEKERKSKEQLGMFAWFCIQQFRKILNKGANGENPFTETPSMIEMRNNYIDGNNPAADFLDNVPVLETGTQDDSVKVSVVKSIFNTYSKENNSNKSMTWKTFKKLLESEDIVEKRTANARVLTGLKLAKRGDYLDIKPYLQDLVFASEYVEIFGDMKGDN